MTILDTAPPLGWGDCCSRCGDVKDRICPECHRCDSLFCGHAHGCVGSFEQLDDQPEPPDKAIPRV